MTSARQRVRALILCTAPAWGGAERHVRDLAAGLNRIGVSASIACLAGSWLESEARRLQIESLILSSGPVASFINELRLAAALRHFDLIHGHLASDYTLTLNAAHRSRRPAVLTRHALDPLSSRRVAAIRASSRVIAVSQAVRTMLLNQYALAPETVRLIPNGVDLNRFCPGDGAPWLSEKGIVPGSFVVTMAGRLARGKGISVFLEAAAILTPTHPAIRFVILGEGPEREAIARQSSGVPLLLPGFDPQIERALRASSILVAPSDREGFGYTVVEAMACARPVVASAIEAHNEIVLDGSNGLLFPPGDALKLAEAVTRLAEDRELASRLGAAGRRRVELHFSLDNMLKGAAAIYAEVLCKS